MKDQYKKLYMNTEKTIYNISVDLIRTICSELNKETKADMLIEKYLLKPSSGSGKKIKDKNAPKKNKSSYMFFTDDIRPKLKKKFPNDSMGELSKRLGKLWKDLKDKDKKKYEKLALKDKERYQMEIKKYKSGGQNINNDELSYEDSSISPDNSSAINDSSTNESS
tara:strand:+ start:10544 stop:11041 length:498 start_codon:yes stop_codon:yes gene_type:complete